MAAPFTEEELLIRLDASADWEEVFGGAYLMEPNRIDLILNEPLLNL